MKSTAKAETSSAVASAAAAGSWADGLGGGADDQWRPGRQTCWAVWREDLVAFEVMQSRGDSLRTMGTTWRGRTMLHAEEGLWLVERGMLAVHPFPRGGGSSLATPAATPSPAAGAGEGRSDKNNSTTTTTTTTSGRSAMVVEDDLVEHGQEVNNRHEKTRKLKEDGTPPQHDEADKRNSTVDRKSGERGQGDVGSSTPKTDPPASRAASGATPSNTEPPPPKEVGGSSGKTPAGGGPRRGSDSKEHGEAAHGHGGRQRAGCKRGRSESGGGRKKGQGSAAPVVSSVPVDVLHGTVLSRAGVPWECYRAYSELKRRSYVVRRRPEDSVGHDDDSPRAAPLSWFGPEPTTARRRSCNSPSNPSRGAACTESKPDTTSSSSSRPSSSLPETFHVYNNPAGSSSSSSSSPFRKRDPGPPNALLVVCRYGDPMPEHRSLVALAERHADMKAKAKTRTSEVTSSWQRQRQRGRDKSATVVAAAPGAGAGAGAARSDADQAPPPPGRGKNRGRKRAPGGGGDGPENPLPLPLPPPPPLSGGAGTDPHRGGQASSQHHHQGEGAGKAESAPRRAQAASGDGARESEMEELPGQQRAGGAGREAALDQRKRGDGLARCQPPEDGEGGREGEEGERPEAEKDGGARMGLLLLAGVERVPPPGVKLAVVSGEAGVQLFDVGLHDDREATQPPGAS